MKRNVKVFGRSIPLWLIVTLAIVTIAAAGYFSYLFTVTVNVNMAPTSGPVVNTLKGSSDTVDAVCAVLADPEGIVPTCSVTTVINAPDHTVTINNAYPGVIVEIRAAVVNRDDEGFGTIYGQIVDTSSMPPEIRYFETIAEPNRPCGLDLDPADGIPPASSDATEEWLVYLLEILDGYDGSSFDVPIEFDQTDPNGSCPTSYP